MSLLEGANDLPPSRLVGEQNSELDFFAADEILPANNEMNAQFQISRD